jgi:hypothetical protein
VTKKAAKSGGKRLKIKRQTLRDLDVKRGKKVRGGLATAISSCECTQYLCDTGNIYCNPVTVGCQTLQCLPTLWGCYKKV